MKYPKVKEIVSYENEEWIVQAITLRGEVVIHRPHDPAKGWESRGPTATVPVECIRRDVLYL